MVNDLETHREHLRNAGHSTFIVEGEKQSSHSYRESIESFLEGVLRRSNWIVLEKTIMRSYLVILLFLVMPKPGLCDPIDTAIADFGYQYLQCEKEEENLVFSPLSLHAAFSMLAMGTQAETREETLKVLHLEEKFEGHYSVFLKSLLAQNQGLRLASKLWPSRFLTLKEAFLSLCESTFAAKPESLDYANTEQARAIINSWVSKRTDSMIPELLPLGFPPSNCELVLTNALHFKAEWANPFRGKPREKALFQSPAGPTTVTMMNGVHPALHHETSDYEVLCLPYENSTLAMALIVPNEAQGWRTLEEQLSSNMIKMADTKNEDDPKLDQIQLALPRFTIRQNSQPLPLLREMGMKRLLGAEANFKAMTDGGLAVTACFHEAVVKVNETGTEAAAATAILMSRGANRPKKSLTVDRPFFFVIYDREAFAPLFIGRVLTPEENKTEQ